MEIKSNYYIYIYNSRKLLLNYSKLFFYIFVFRATLGGSHFKNGEYGEPSQPRLTPPDRPLEVRPGDNFPGAPGAPGAPGPSPSLASGEGEREAETPCHEPTHLFGPAGLGLFAATTSCSH